VSQGFNGAAVCDEETCMTSKTDFITAGRWTRSLDSERLQEHDFKNLLVEFKYAIDRQDQMMMEYCESELNRMYRERRHTGAAARIANTKGA
jgi:hypothetical protein